LQFHPKQIILFGSYAYGKPRPESDVDLLVVMETQLRESEQALRIRQHVTPMFGVDILVYTPSRLEQRLEWGDSFLSEITEKGLVMYESLTLEWIDKAEGDLPGAVDIKLFL